MGAYDGAIALPPDTAHGTPTGFGDWRWSVEALLPSESSAIVGTAVVGTATVAEGEWFDLTPHARGMTWGRGASEFLGRWEVGVGTLTLDSRSAEFSAWNIAGLNGRGVFLEPGLTIRCGLRSATDTRADGWLPQFCGEVESWPSEIAGLAADEWATVTIVETVSRLARIDDNALPAPVGAGDDTVDRITRLLEASDWLYGLEVAYTGPDFTIQSTEMSLNRLAECYLTADSGTVRFHTGKDGRARLAVHKTVSAYVTPVAPLVEQFTGAGGQPWFRTNPDDGGFLDVIIAPETVVYANDNAALLNALTVSVANTAVTESTIDEPSRRRYGLIASTITNLITAAADAVAVASAWLFLVDARRRAIRRVERLEATNLLGTDQLGVIAALDLGDALTLVDDRPALAKHVFSNGTVNAMSHAVTPLPGRVRWVATFDINTDDLIVNDD